MSSVKQLEMLTIPCAEGERVTSVVMSPVSDFMGAILASASARVYNLQTGRLEANFPKTGPVRGMAFRPRCAAMPSNEMAVAVGEQACEVLRLDLELGIGLIPVLMPRANCVAYSHEGRYMACGSTDGLVRVYDLTGPATDRPESRWMQTDKGMRQVWSIGEPLLDGPPKEVLSVKVGRSCVTGLAFDATSDSLFVTTAEAKLLRLVVWQPELPAEPYLRNAHDKDAPFEWDCYCVGAHPQDALVGFGGKDGNVYVANTRTGNLTTLTTNVGSFVSKLEFLAAEKQLVMLGASGVEVWDLSLLRPVALSGNVTPGKLALAARQYGQSLFVAQA